MPLSATAAVPLAVKYFRRLGIDPEKLDAQATIGKLQIIQEAHLSKIPFENLAQHECARPAVLDIEQTAVKTIDHRRGGFCFELNGLLAEFLTELGYSVCRVPSFVCIDPDNDVFRETATHLILVVDCQPANEQKSSTWIVDVGFGEPAIHPLLYNYFGVEQRTPEGMRSKLIRKGDDVHLLWYRSRGGWVPRLKWKYEESLLGSNGPPLSSFAKALEDVQEPTSVFSQKMIVCLVTREKKLTVAGNQLKITGPPRFSDQDPTFVEHFLDSKEAVQKILHDNFGIPFEETQDMCLVRSIAADPSI